MPLTISSEPVTEPITTAEAKTQAKITTSADDTYVDTLIAKARRACEDETGLAFITQTWVLRLEGFPDEIKLWKFPVIAISSIAYVDQNGDSQTLASSDYQTDIYSRPARIKPAYGETWPSTRDQYSAVTVTFTCGYGGASAVPNPLKHAVKMLVSHFYENREPVNIGNIVSAIPMTVQYLLDPYKYPRYAMGEDG